MHREMFFKILRNIENNKIRKSYFIINLIWDLNGSHSYSGIKD